MMEAARSSETLVNFYQTTPQKTAIFEIKYARRQIAGRNHNIKVGNKPLRKCGKIRIDRVNQNYIQEEI
jgi:hypothetical protein